MYIELLIQEGNGKNKCTSILLGTPGSDKLGITRPHTDFVMRKGDIQEVTFAAAWKETSSLENPNRGSIFNPFQTEEKHVSKSQLCNGSTDLGERWLGDCLGVSDNHNPAACT